MVDYSDLDLPRFASDDAQADIVEPTSAKKDLGWVGDATPDRPPAQFQNWLRRQSYEAHNTWREILWFTAADSWTPRDSDMISAASNIDIQDTLVMHNLDLVLACGGLNTSTGSISSSPDGSAWTERANVANGHLRGMATNGSLILAVGGTATGANKKIYSSADGTTWTDRTAGYTLANPDAPFSDVVYDGINSLWIIVTAGGEIYTSPDPLAAATWTLRHDFGSGADLQHIGHNPSSGKSIVSADNSTPKVSTDGITWAALTLTGVSGTWDPQAGQVVYARQDSKDIWVMSGRFTDGTTRTGFIFSEDDGVNWGEMEPDNGYPFYTGANSLGDMIGYSPVLKHWLFGEHESSAGPYRVWAGQPGNLESFSLRNFPPVMTDFDNVLPANAVWVDLAASRKDQFWLLGADADSDEAILQSGNPII